MYHRHMHHRWAIALMAFGAIAACGAPAEPWETVTSAEGGFSVRMPGHPKFSEKALTDANGKPVHGGEYIVSSNARTYIVQYLDYVSPISLDNAIDSMARALPDSRVTARRATTMFGYPARVADIETPQFHVRVRDFAVKSRRYQIAILMNLDAFDAAAADTFLDSFELR
jgi:hypothetical protein